MELRRFEPDELAELAELAAQEEESAQPHYFRDESDTWWALDAAGRGWFRYDEDGWRPGRSPMTALIGAPVSFAPATGTPEASRSWPPPPLLSAKSAARTIPPVAPTPQGAAEPFAREWIGLSDAQPEQEEPAPSRPRKRRRRRSTRRWGLGVLSFLGSTSIIASTLLPWMRGSLGEHDAFAIQARYLVSKSGVAGGGFTVGDILLALAVPALLLSFVPMGSKITRALGLMSIIAVAMFLTQLSDEVLTLKGSRIGGEELLDIAGYGAALALLGGIFVLVGRTGRRRW